MTVSELIAALSAFEPDSEVVLRDLNGLDWSFDELMLKSERELPLGSSRFVVIDSEGVNKVP